MIDFPDAYRLGEMTSLPGIFASWSINTRITWPTFYWSQGWVSFAVFFLVCSCLALAVITSLDRLHKETPSPSLPLWPCLITAAGLMQFLPTASHGIQLIPSFPWEYWGHWISFSFSILIWLFLLVSATSARGIKPGDQVDTAGFGMMMLGLTILLTPCHPSYGKLFIATTMTMQEEKTIHQPTLSSGVDQHRQQLNQWKARYENTRESLKQLEKDKSNVLNQLKSIDVPSESNRTTSQVSQELAGEVEELERQIRNVERERDLLQSSIVRAESKIRRIERLEMLKQTAVLSDEEAKQLAALQLELDGHLYEPASYSATVNQVLKDQVLKQVFGSKGTSN